MEMERLPKRFIENMKKQLPENEWEAFFAVYGQKPYKGVRINRLKTTPQEMENKLPFLGEKTPFCDDAYYCTWEKIGNTVWHTAGLVYSQEPSATSVAPTLNVRAGERVLDLCSAPGGKGTQMACRMDGKGIIVLNEPILSRAKILSQNVERMGVANAVVLCETPETLSKKFVEYFDKILVDAPCSGEGMFRKNAEEALKEWSEENVQNCALRQSKILNEATKMLKVGGRLAYSTCTFSYAEDEGQVLDYLKNYPEMQLVKQEKIYPHKSAGEGHFWALFEKTEKGKTDEEFYRLPKPAKRSVSCSGEKAYREFEKEFFKQKFAFRLHEADGVLYELPEDIFDWKGLHVLRAGVKLGEVKNGRFEPSHALCMRVKKTDCVSVADFALTDERLEKYLRGETVETDAKKGWCLVCADGYPIGLGKVSGGVMKNHLPKALRFSLT